MSKKGFTLIELLVVVSIIGLLASIVVVSLGGARSQGRDAKRQADLRQIQTAQELCYNDRTGCGSATANDYHSADWAPNAAANVICGVTALAAGRPLVGAYLNVAPTDPGSFEYRCFSGATPSGAFCVSIQLEQPPVPATPYIHARNTGLFPNQSAHCTSPTG